MAPPGLSLADNNIGDSNTRCAILGLPIGEDADHVTSFSCAGGLTPGWMTNEPVQQPKGQRVDTAEGEFPFKRAADPMSTTTTNRVDQTWIASITESMFNGEYRGNGD